MDKISEDTHSIRIYEKLEEHSVVLAEIRTTLKGLEKDVSKNTVDLDTHIKGVRACEARIAPIEQHVALVGKVLNLLAWFLGVAIVAALTAWINTWFVK